MDKQTFIAKKVKELKEQGYTLSQATAISFALFNKENREDTPKAQFGGATSFDPNTFSKPYTFTQPQSLVSNNQNNFNANYTQPNFSPAPNTAPLGKSGMFSSMQQFDSSLFPKPATEQENLKSSPEEEEKQPLEIDFTWQAPANRINTGMYNLGKGNKTAGFLGISSGLLGSVREGMSMYGAGREEKRGQNEFQANKNRQPNYYAGQEGGKVKNSQLLTGQYITEEPEEQVNQRGEMMINAEDGEYIRDAETGEVRQIVGEKHLTNGGKKAEGTNVGVGQGDKIISDYIKIPNPFVKEIQDRFGVKVKKGDTIANAIKKNDNQLGIKKLTDELAEVIEKVAKNENVKDEATRILNEKALLNSAKKIQAKLDMLKEPRAMFADYMFEVQETVPKKGDGSQLFDKKGNVVEDSETMAQQGGMMDIATKYGISPERAQELISMQQGGYVKTGTQNIADKDVTQINKNTGIQFTNDFAKEYFSTGMPEQVMPKRNAIQDMPTIDITSDGQWADRKVWKTQRPEWFVGKKEPKEGVDYTVVPYSQWNDYQNSKEYSTYKNRNNAIVDSYQEGGQMPQEGQQPDIMQVVAQMLQEGLEPEQIMQQLVEMGVPQEQVGQVLQEVVAQMQGQQEQAPMQEEQAMMQQGGKKYAQQSFDFMARYPETNKAGYETFYDNIVPTGQMTGVEAIQSFNPNGYGKQVQPVEETINKHSWYFDTEDKKNKFREATKKKGSQKEVLDFQHAYNGYLTKTGKADGLTDKEIQDLINKVGFTKTGVQKDDGLFGAYTSSRGLKREELKPTSATPTAETKTPFDYSKLEAEQNKVIEEQKPNTYLPDSGVWRPQMTPEGGMSPYLSSNMSGRVVPDKATAEPQIAEGNRQLNTYMEQLQQSGLSPQAQAATFASMLSSTQDNANKAISSVEMANRAEQRASDYKNLGLERADFAYNEQNKDRYVSKEQARRDNLTKDWGNFYKDDYQNRASIARQNQQLSLLGMTDENFGIDSSGRVFYRDTKSQDYRTPQLEKAIGELTKEQQNKLTEYYNAGMSRLEAFRKVRG